jgi:hypothetical protein
MDNYPMDQRTHPSSAAQLSDQRARIALRAAMSMLVPLARWLVRNGVHYASFAPALKSVFVEAARRELQATGAKLTDSSLSVLSGVQRRDIRAFGQNTTTDAEPKTPSVASQVFTRWVTDPAWRDGTNQPMALPKTGAPRSFDSLAREVSSDVHPRTLLAEMLRLGLIEPDGETVRLCAHAFVPQEGFDGRALMFSANVADHIAAAAHNVVATDGRFLEQSVFGSGLAPASVEALGETARRLWAGAFEQIVREATHRFERDRIEPQAQMRMRFGVYYYAEPDEELLAKTGQAPLPQ